MADNMAKQTKIIKKQTEIMREQTEIMVKQTDSLIKQTETNLKEFELKIRPYIKITERNGALATLKFPGFPKANSDIIEKVGSRVYIKNYGDMPGYYIVSGFLNNIKLDETKPLIIFPDEIVDSDTRLYDISELFNMEKMEYGKMTVERTIEIKYWHLGEKEKKYIYKTTIKYESGRAYYVGDTIAT